MRVSAVIIAKNEEKKIANAINSVLWADEVLLVDSGSTDRTIDIAASLGARVMEQEWLGFGPQKQFAADAAKYDWILSIDADEVVTPELSQEIGETISGGPKHDGYYLSRLAFYHGRPIRHCGWYPDWQLRLFDRRVGKWSDALIHEAVRMPAEARIGRLRNDLLHYSIDSFAEHAKMIQERYAPLSAEQMLRNGRRTNTAITMFSTVWAFLHTYVIRLGFLDGIAGFAISGFAAYNVFLKHLMLIEKQKGWFSN